MNLINGNVKMLSVQQDGMSAVNFKHSNFGVHAHLALEMKYGIHQKRTRINMIKKHFITQHLHYLIHTCTDCDTDIDLDIIGRLS